MTFKEFNFDKKMAFNVSIVTLIALAVAIFQFGGKFKIAEQGLSKVPNVCEKLEDHEQRIKMIETTQDLRFKSIDDKLDILIKSRRDRREN